ncbi:hypothetical protein PV325_008284 [Microctonus aethiopoides]|nr:hypothetical protein PV325_008284 [Microctonus aethiopoides]
MWQSGGMGAHAANNPWMKLMGIVHKERRHHDSGGGASGGQGTTAAGANERGLTQYLYKRFLVVFTSGLIVFRSLVIQRNGQKRKKRKCCNVHFRLIS